MPGEDEYPRPTENDLHIIGVILTEIERINDQLYDLSEKQTLASQEERECKSGLRMYETAEDKRIFRNSLAYARESCDILFEIQKMHTECRQINVSILEPMLLKCYRYGVIVACSDLGFIEAVDHTTNVIVGACEMSPYSVAQHGGIIATVFEDRYQIWLRNNPIERGFKPTEQVSIFARVQGMKTRAVNDHLKHLQRIREKVNGID